MVSLSELTSSLRVTEYKLNLVGYDYSILGEKFIPTREVVAINSNFMHKCYNGYEKFLIKPKEKLDKNIRKRGGLKMGDRSVFNACIEFTVVIKDNNDGEIARVVRYFPKSGRLQLFTKDNIIKIFLQFLRYSGIPGFSSVKIVEERVLLNNYRLDIMLPPEKLIDLKQLEITLNSDYSKEIIPFPIHYIMLDSNTHTKIAIVFTEKIRMHIWPKSGKVNIFGTKTEFTASLIYNFLSQLFKEKEDVILTEAPIPDKKIA